ncbi:MAG: shikimate kinase [Bacteroidota bacterium]|nr:shikimate kinase [Bacteroidota bacterium]MDP4214038.1 shikimate kinase [Bacteroidota bacterium]MDP4249774.1 shikimate kinase [Bacteroidota bacterium]
MRIFLIGFMGSGKTFWGTKIAESLQIPFYDLDAVIVGELEMTIPEIFKIKGEEFFRYKEKQVLEELVAKKESFVLSSGGGTPCFFNNIKFMKRHGKVVWLNTSTQVLQQRLMKERLTRPLLRDISEPELHTYIVRKLGERKMYYEQADVTVREDELLLEPLISLLK